MIEGQTQSEHEFAHLLGRVRFADNQAAALLLIDNELDQGKFQPASLQGPLEAGLGLDQAPKSQCSCKQS